MSGTKSKIWTPENTWRLMEMRNIGKTFVEIAAVFGVSKSCVRDRYLRETDTERYLAKRKLYAQKYNSTHRDEIREKGQTPECLRYKREWAKKNYQKHREKFLERNRKWRENNPDKARRSSKAYYQAHRCEILARQREADRRKAEERRKAGETARRAVRKPVKSVAQKTVKPAPKPAPRPVKPSPAWTEVQDMMLTAMALSGVPACDIARALNRPEKECRRRAKELGAVMPPKPKPYSPSFTSDEEFLPGREDFADDLTEVLHVDA